MKNEDIFELAQRGEGVPEEASYGIRVSGAMTGDIIPDGSVVYVKANAPLEDGDVGIFLYKDEVLCRQICEDSFGNLYLLTLDREKADFDLVVKKDEKIVSFGKVILKKKIPLPL